MKMGIDEDLSTSATMVSSLQKRNLGSSKRPKPINASSSSVSIEELKLFHSIDRRLFTRLVLAFGRDPTQSAQIMALWMWIELNGNERNLVYKALMNTHNNVLSALADESVWVLICIEASNAFPFNIVPEVFLLQEISSSRVTLRYFHQNRAKIGAEVTKLLLNVCLRVFDDLLLLQPYQERKAADDAQSNVEESVNRGGRGFDPNELAVLRRSLNEELEEI